MENNLQTLSRSAILAPRPTQQTTLRRVDGFASIKETDGVVYLTPSDLPALKNIAKISIGSNFRREVQKKYNPLGKQGDWGKNWSPIFGYNYSPTGLADNEIIQMEGVIGKFMGNFNGLYYRDPLLEQGGRKCYALWSYYEKYAPQIPVVIKGLQDFYKKVQNKATDITEEIWNDYQKTGCYYTDSEMTINGKKVRYALEVTYDAVLAYNIIRTGIEQEHTNQEEEKAWQDDFKAHQENLQAQQKMLESIRERYQSQIFYSKLLRYGLVGCMALVLVVGIVYAIVIAAKASKKK